VRTVAARAGTTTRAVYALFGSKDGLVQALAQRGFALLMDRVAAVSVTGDPGRDLVVCSVEGFRRFALEHPDLLRLFFAPPHDRPPLSAESTATRLSALGQLVWRVERAERAGLLGDHTVEEVTLLWDAVCTGLAMREICLPPTQREQFWTDALTALLRGLGAVDAGPRPRRRAHALDG
jgi:AcrR family transcriptional regulator